MDLPTPRVQPSPTVSVCARLSLQGSGAVGLWPRLLLVGPHPHSTDSSPSGPRPRSRGFQGLSSLWVGASVLEDLRAVCLGLAAGPSKPAMAFLKRREQEAPRAAPSPAKDHRLPEARPGRALWRQTLVFCFCSHPCLK